LTGFESFAQLLDDRVDGLVDAALEVHRVRAGGHALEAFLDDGLGEHGRRRGAVTGDVRRSSTATSRTICAPMFSIRVVELDLLGDGHAVLGDGRRAPLLVEDDVAATAGPSVTFTALARISTPLRISARACSLNRSILAAIGPPEMRSQAARRMARPLGITSCC
jgi:hypothetical protein